ncbi:MAG TPA: potassium channel family protein [Acidimicrobiia bacterium]|nr:potassium channel family protein [Acidimicrobiia bacterium]
METASVPQEAGAGTATRVPAYRFGIVLLLLLATFIFLASGPTGDWVPLVAVVLQGATLLAAFAASGVGHRLWRLGVVVVLVALVSAAAAIFVSGDELTGTLFLLNLLFVAAAPVVIVNSLVRRRVIDVRTVLGALCVYVLIGMMWSFAYTAVGTIDSEPFFAQQAHATVADYLYFSFVTLTTTGYGDLTAAHGLGRALAVLEALIGQLYLVTVIALLVSNIGRRGGLRQPQA